LGVIKGGQGVTPRQVAHALSKYFLSEGQYEDVGRPASPTKPIQALAHEYGIELDEELAGFYGLEIRAVGYADTVEGEAEQGCFVYVTRSTRRAERALPEKIEGVPVRLRRVGRMYIKPEISASAAGSGYAHRHRGRICCGTSISVGTERSAGTLGALLISDTKTIYALSNNHVIGGCNHTARGQPVLSPSIIDVNPNSPSVQQFGRFDSLVELRSGNVDYVPTANYDAAIAAIEGDVSSYQGEYFDTPSEIASFMAGQRVKKVGRTTRLSSGFVESRVAGFFPLPYKADRFTAVVNFDDVWIIRAADPREPFALRGDSGSLIVAEDEQHALGLLFAATLDGQYGWAAPLEDVLIKLGKGLKLLSGVLH